MTNQIIHINESILKYLVQRPKNSHKGLFGHVLVVGGDYGMPGAPRLAAEGALRVGAGVVSVVTRSEHISTVMCNRPELLCYGINNEFNILNNIIKNISFIIIGPGLGNSEWSKKLLCEMLNSNIPILIDADGLNLLQQYNLTINQPHIITPHPGEAARLLNISAADVQRNRIQSIQNLYQAYSGIVVLKGQNTLVYDGNNTIYQCDDGNPGMSSAGMGDLLSGIIGGLAAQGIELGIAAQLGVFMHAKAGDQVAALKGERGILASDLLNFI